MLDNSVALQALDVNLNPLWYGVMAEIGAGQVGKASVPANKGLRLEAQHPNTYKQAK